MTSPFVQLNVLSSPTTSVPSMDDSSSADEQLVVKKPKRSYKSKKDDSESSREIRREYKKEWYEKNREKALAKMKEYYEKRKQAGTLHRRSMKQKKAMAQQQSAANVHGVVANTTSVSMPAATTTTTAALPSMDQLQHRHASMPLTRFVYDESSVCRTSSPWGYDRLPSFADKHRPDQAYAHLSLLCEVALMQ
ncbi:hypothetical protein AC1031_004954 [Aphanomyces cochlioides]|nr:hypothetical protein AC1031_004954 [Aphanomyces cochlioides]